MKYKNYSSFLSFEETREYAKKLGLKTAREWQKTKHPENIFKRPDVSFKNKGWTNWGDFLGIYKIYLSFEETKNYAKSLNINSSEWKKIKHPKNIYKNPQIAFKNKGWTNWFDFLGLERTKKYAKKVSSFNEARNYARSLNLKSKREWDKINHPPYIYSNPEDCYKNKGWIDWYDFLGKIKKRYLSYEDTKIYAKSLNINSSEWKKIKHPNNIYKNPQIAFKNKGWTNWKNFLGI